MTSDTMPPTLDDMGHVLWGTQWREALAKGLNVTREEVDAWESDFDSRPADLERMIEDLGMTRLEEIGCLLLQMKEMGLSDK